MAYVCWFHPLTKQDFDEAYTWYEENRTGLVEHFLKVVRQKIEEIILHLESCRSRSNKKFREAQADIFPCMIVYKINKQKKIVCISSIHHPKKHPRKKCRK